MTIVELSEEAYASLPMHISANSIYTLTRPDAMTLSLKKAPREPFAFDVADEHPEAWKTFITMRNFKMFGIYEENRLAAAMSLVHDNPSVRMLDGREDVLLVWDLRVHPDYQRKGYGKALIAHAENEAKTLGVKHLRIETQNTNPNAVDFYSSMGFELSHIREHAYSGESLEDAGGENEIMLIFNKIMDIENPS